MNKNTNKNVTYKNVPYKNVIVTGAGGFLGSHLAERFLDRGLGVIGIDNFSTGFRKNQQYLEAKAKPEKLYFIEADVCEPWAWLEKIPESFGKEVSHVFHFASPASPPLYQAIPKETLWVNSIGLERCLSFADSVNARVIFASTSEVYGDPKISPQPESYWGHVNSFGARSCYDEGKRFGEALIYSHNDRKQTKHGMVRIFNTYGSRMNPSDGRVIINLLIQAMKNEPLTIYGTGKQTRSFCYVDDLIDGILSYGETDLAEPVNIGNQNEFTILELAEVIQKIFKEKDLKLSFLPSPKDDPQQRRPDLTKAKDLLAPWSPKIELEEGLKQMIGWLSNELPHA